MIHHLVDATGNNYGGNLVHICTLDDKEISISMPALADISGEESFNELSLYYETRPDQFDATSPIYQNVTTRKPRNFFLEHRLSDQLCEDQILTNTEPTEFLKRDFELDAPRRHTRSSQHGDQLLDGSSLPPFRRTRSVQAQDPNTRLTSLTPISESPEPVRHKPSSPVPDESSSSSEDDRIETVIKFHTSNMSSNTAFAKVVNDNSSSLIPQLSAGEATPAVLSQYEKAIERFFAAKKSPLDEKKKLEQVYLAFTENVSMSHWIDSERDEKGWDTTDTWTVAEFFKVLRNQFLEDGWDRRIHRQQIQRHMSSSETVDAYKSRLLYNNNLLRGTPYESSTAKLKEIMQVGLLKEINDYLELPEHLDFAKRVDTYEFHQWCMTLNKVQSGIWSRGGAPKRDRQDDGSDDYNAKRMRSSSSFVGAVTQAPPPRSTGASNSNWTPLGTRGDMRNGDMRNDRYTRDRSPRRTGARGWNSWSREKQDLWRRWKDEGVPMAPGLSDSERAILRLTRGCFNCREVLADHQAEHCPLPWARGDKYQERTEAYADHIIIEKIRKDSTLASLVDADYLKRAVAEYRAAHRSKRDKPRHSTPPDASFKHDRAFSEPPRPRRRPVSPSTTAAIEELITEGASTSKSASTKVTAAVLPPDVDLVVGATRAMRNVSVESGDSEEDDELDTDEERRRSDDHDN